MIRSRQPARRTTRRDLAALYPAEPLGVSASSWADIVRRLDGRSWYITAQEARTD